MAKLGVLVGALLLLFGDDEWEDVAATPIRSGSDCDSLKVCLEASASRSSRLPRVRWRLDPGPLDAFGILFRADFVVGLLVVARSVHRASRKSTALKSKVGISVDPSHLVTALVVP